MNNLQLKPMSGYKREDLLDDDQSGQVVFSSSQNLTSIDNPNHHPLESGYVHIQDVNVPHEIELNSPTSSNAVLASHFSNQLTGNGPNNGRTNTYTISFGNRSNFKSSKHPWSKLSSFEKTLFWLIFILTAVIFTLCSILYTQPSHHIQISNVGPCLSSKCIITAASIIDSLDTSINPCNDFYEYSCGGWIKKNPLPDGHASWGTFGKLTQDNQLILKNVLEDKNRRFNYAETKAKIYYESCMDRNGTVEKLKEKPLKEFIDLIGGWNISGGFNVRAWDHQTKLTLIHNVYNRGGLFEWSVSADEKNSSRNVLNLQQGGFIMPRDYYLNKTDQDDIIVAYLDFMTKIGVLVGGQEPTVRKQMIAVLGLEREIAKILIPPEQLRDDQKLYHKLTLKELTNLSPFLDWTKYFKEAFAPINRLITEQENIVVYTPEYIGNLSILMNEYLRDDYKKTVLVNTIVWSVVQPMVTYLSKPFRDAAKQFSQALVGSEGTTTQWRYCISDTGSLLGFALGSMFVKASFRGESRNESRLMIHQIKDAFKANLNQLTWMDSTTIKLAEEKADAITDMIGFPDFILDETKLNERYQNLNVKEDQYFKNSISSNIFILNEFIKKLDKPANKSEWDMPPPVVNAYYAPTKNQIAFPAGILQSPFYDVDRPQALNFGAMGVVMGHELTHAFDDQGREYDKVGNLQEWWQQSTILKFQERMKCFQKQYSAYQLGKDYVNGRQTLGENVADNGGLTAAFHAFTKWSETNVETVTLPGLNYTSNQLFFIGFAQVWCSINTPEASKLQIRNDPHTPSKFRVIGTLSNSPDFARAFECPLGTSMNPNKKCIVW